MGRFVDEKTLRTSEWSNLYLDTKEKLEELNSIKDSRYPDLADRCFSDAVYKERQESYMKLNGVKRTKGDHCLHRLLGMKKCVDSDCKPPGNDHGNLWIKDGEPYSYTFEPYHLSKKTIGELVELCDKHGLDFHIKNRSFHNPAGTMFVEIKKK